MAGQFELGPKHEQVAKNTQELVKKIEDEACKAGKNLKEVIKSYLPEYENLYDDYLGMIVAIEEIAKQDSLTASVLADQITFKEVMKAYGNVAADQVLAGNQTIGLLCLEPGYTCFGDLQTRASKTQNGWQLSGTKLISNEQLYSDKYMIFARDEEDKVRLFAVTEEEVKVKEGEKFVSSAKIALNQAEINLQLQDACCVGLVNDNFEKIQTIARTLIAAVAVGIGHSAVANSIQVAKETKKTNGDAISTSQSLQFTLADMFTEVEGSRMLTYLSADSMDKGNPSVKIASMAKVKASEAATSTATEALHIFGNVGFISNKDLSLVQRATDCRIKGGTNRNQRRSIYQYMLAKK